MHRIQAQIAVVAAAILGSSAAVAAPISINSIGAAYTQNFDTLANTGTTNSTLPLGWALNETGTSARVNGQYAASNGSDNAGDVYSFGSTGSTERAFGTLLSGTLTPMIGASFVNNAGGTLTALVISYIGEQWRLGLDNRNAADRLDFQYSLDATSLTTGAWIDFNALDFNSPTTTGTVNTLDGNAAANRTALNSTITGLSIANGATFWIRWTDFNIANADDGLAVDEFSLMAAPEPGTGALVGLALAICVASRFGLRRRQSNLEA